ncbi:MAG: hypothetical protein DMF54_06995 [Acidobacteria bacterium]|nr:MAG: hypothetical protein DMF54_06995 [Acidobacteriota bacterium]
MTIEFKDFGFAPAYKVDINPEYPAAGEWEVPNYLFGGRSTETLTIRISPQLTKPWVASFAVVGNGHYVTGLFACPNPEQVLVAAGTDAYLIQVTRPGHADDLPISPVLHIHRPSGMDLLVVGSFTNLAAVDDSGLRWVTGRLFIDDLELVEGPPGKICVRGSVNAVPSAPETLIIDPSRGELIEGPKYTDVAHPHGEPGWCRDGI